MKAGSKLNTHCVKLGVSSVDRVSYFSFMILIKHQFDWTLTPNATLRFLNWEGAQ